MAFLGCIVSNAHIQVVMQKIETVKTWPRHMTPIEVRSFLGLAGYYRRFAEGFSLVLASLTKLNRNADKFQWTIACEQSF